MWAARRLRPRRSRAAVALALLAVAGGAAATASSSYVKPTAPSLSFGVAVVVDGNYMAVSVRALRVACAVAVCAFAAFGWRRRWRSGQPPSPRLTLCVALAGSANQMHDACK